MDGFIVGKFFLLLTPKFSINRAHEVQKCPNQLFPGGFRKIFQKAEGGAGKPYYTVFTNAGFFRLLHLLSQVNIR
jgi:hypothetical protein